MFSEHNALNLSEVLLDHIFTPDSILHGMVSGKPSEDGSYFIDRDGTHFRYILNYLRTGQLVVPEDKFVRRELLAEAEFYHVQGIIKVLRRFKDSVILSSDQGQTLINWLMETRAFTNTNEELLYRASRDGWGASNFHSCCDNKGPTVTVVKSGNYIFGGYTEETWDCRCYKYYLVKRELPVKTLRREPLFVIKVKILNPRTNNI